MRRRRKGHVRPLFEAISGAAEEALRKLSRVPPNLINPDDYDATEDLRDCLRGIRALAERAHENLNSFWSSEDRP